MIDLTGKSVLVVGAGISGIGSATLLEEKGALPILYDGNGKLTEETVREKLPEGSHAEIVLGAFPKELAQRISLAVLSPGVPTDLDYVLYLKEQKIPVWGEIELAYNYGKGRVIAITGTNGKTTTTSLVGQIMQEYHENVYIVGNIGNPYTQAAPLMDEDTVSVAEISSFQLETIEYFHPQVSAILNITPDHLNRHHTMENYIAAKEAITMNQTKDDYCILNYENAIHKV